MRRPALTAVVPRVLYGGLLVKCLFMVRAIRPDDSGVHVEYAVLTSACALLAIEVAIPNSAIWWMFAVLAGLYGCLILFAAVRGTLVEFPLDPVFGWLGIVSILIADRWCRRRALKYKQ